MDYYNIVRSVTAEMVDCVIEYQQKLWEQHSIYCLYHTVHLFWLSWLANDTV